MFGYPKICDRCPDICGRQLRVTPFFDIKSQYNLRVMLVGQDPTIFKRSERVNQVLMLDEKNSQLKRWLMGLFGDNFSCIDIYATNIVKCSFNNPPSTQQEGGLKFLEKFAEKCSGYLMEEIVQYKPDLLITFGETTHKLFCNILKDTKVPLSMKDAFNGNFTRVNISGCTFDYSPCLHIKTFRIAEKYGDAAKNFKCKIEKYFCNSGNAQRLTERQY